MSNDLFEEFDDSGSTVFRDVILLALTGFVAIVLLLLPHVNPPGQSLVTADEPPGNVIIELFWDEDRDVDVDLWVKAPGDVPVGYSNRGGLFFNLLRDDLGKYKDPTPINYEVAFSRGISPGVHVVNAHLYRMDAAGDRPFAAKVVVTTVDPTSKVRTQILETELELVVEGEEVTVFHFALTKTGALTAGSVNNTPTRLRSEVHK